MRIAPLLIGVCLLPVLTGCHKPAIGAAVTTMKNTGVAAIATKYPDLGLSDLKLRDINITVMPNGEQTAFVIFDVPTSAKTVTNENKQAITTIKTIVVGMSLSGKVESVKESKRAEAHNVAQ